MQIFMEWLDLLWVPIGFLVLHKGQRFKTALFVLSCVLTLRLQVELMQDIGFANGFVDLLDFPLLQRGFIVYGAFIAGFMMLSHYSKERDPYIFIAAAITVFFAAFCTSSLVLVL